MRALTSICYPLVGTEVTFQLKNGTLLAGRFDFNKTFAQRWIDENGNEYTFDQVAAWNTLNEPCVKKCHNCSL